MTQHETILALFKQKSGVLYTHDFMTPTLAYEYRRSISDLRKKGYVIACEPVKRNLFKYRLLEAEKNGQLRLA